MAERSLVEILLRARGGRQVQGEFRQGASGADKLRRSYLLADKAAGKFGSAMRTAGKWAARTGAVVGGATVFELKRATDAWEEHAKVVADTARVIKTTDGVANVTAAHVDKLANSIENKTAVDDDAIAAGQNMLLTFLRVRNEAGKGNKVFDRATGLAVDMAARFGGDTAGAFKQLGKALDDPIKGITALRRTGVSFTQAERDKIKTLEESGRHLEAQRMILDALDKQVGGSAKAQARPLDKMKRACEDLEKVIGKAASPAVSAFADAAQHEFEHLQPMFDALSADLDKLADRKDLSLGEKLVEAGHLTSKHFEPLANEIKQGLKDANLAQKLSDVIEWAVPKMAQAFATAGPAAVKALVHGFDEAGPAGKLLIAWFTGKKLGLGKLAMGGILGGGKGGGLLERGGSPANPMFVVDVSNGVPGGGMLPGGKKAPWFKRALPKALTAAKRLAPWAIAADALIDPDATGGGQRPDGTYRDTIPMSQRIAQHDAMLRRRARGADQALFDRSTGGRRPGHGPISRRDAELVADLMAPIRLDVDGEKFADAAAKIRIRYRHRK